MTSPDSVSESGIIFFTPISFMTGSKNVIS